MRLKELREKLPMVTGADSDNAKKEHSSFLAIARLIDRSLEAIQLLTSLTKIADPTLGVGVLGVAYRKLESSQEQLLHLTFASLIADQHGADLMNRLLEAVIDIAPDAVKQFRGVCTGLIAVGCRWCAHSFTHVPPSSACIVPIVL